MRSPLSFPKEEKLTGRDQVDKLFAEGSSFSLTPLRVYYRVVEQTGRFPVRLLIAVPRRKFRRAVDRNRIRRLIREAYRLQKAALAGTLYQAGLQIHLALVFTGSELPPYDEIASRVKSCLQKLQKAVVSP